MQAFMTMKKDLDEERQYVEGEIMKRIDRLKTKTANSKADISQLTDNEFMELMVTHQDGMTVQLDKQLVRAGKFADVEQAAKAHATLTVQLLAHAHEHSETLFRVAEVSQANIREIQPGMMSHQAISGRPSFR
jgi:hypothetical protein